MPVTSRKAPARPIVSAAAGKLYRVRDEVREVADTLVDHPDPKVHNAAKHLLGVVATP